MATRERRFPREREREVGGERESILGRRLLVIANYRLPDNGDGAVLTLARLLPESSESCVCQHRTFESV